ncbi:MAG TPA: DUF5989 family protein [Bacteroidia bacterium]|nr:DUF5989 family protein [Bacteroidia bacterium]HMU19776.1 DUF5989 family protein [Bacteroidia bacterium]HNB13718.1 DUF5989 family protein [Bacteroidia bacterium]HNH67575.1 DUF5989 family protein [Bacteroidia bacterium]HNN11234.1 DUF5989 family protein [Bacteroidia bacterium]
MELLTDLFRFIIQRKKYWLAPLILVILLMSVLIIIGGNPALAPFIYTLF